MGYDFESDVSSKSGMDDRQTAIPSVYNLPGKVALTPTAPRAKKFLPIKKVPR